MLGAIIGDIVGSTREWYNIKTEDFELVPNGSCFTDDTVMTLAVAKWLMDDPDHSPESLVKIMQELGRKYPRAGYGGMFRNWLYSDHPQPYGSFGNGSAMRVSPVGLYANSLEEALELARITASVTHNHPEGIKGAQAIAACVYLQKSDRWRTHEEIKQYVEKTFGYDLSIKLEDIREEYGFDVTCQGSVPIAIMAFLQRQNTLDTLRLAISMGGDSDTIGCMAVSIALSQPDSRTKDLEEKCRQLLTPELLDINDSFETFVNRPLIQSYYIGTRMIFAGEYPGDKYGEKAEAKIRQMTHFGVKHFIDLTEEGELVPYAHLLPADCTHTRFPIPDVSTPQSVDDVYQLMRKINQLLKRDDGYIYIHCWGGVGRTGTIVGCYLADDMEEPSFDTVMKNLRYHFSEMPKSAHRVTPETSKQVAFIKAYVESIEERRMRQKEWVKDCIRGCMMGGAAGDALGYPVEFLSRGQILSKYGQNGITQFKLDQNGKALVSDDTQMTLFTANGMLMGVTRGCMRGVGGEPEKYVNGAYIDWYYTQTGNLGTFKEKDDYHYTWLRDLPELAHQRAPGMTCMSACYSLVNHQQPVNDSHGCGGLMRVAPMGLLDAAFQQMNNRGFYGSATRLAQAGAVIAKTTHLHPLGYLPAALMTLLIARLVPLTPQEAKESIISIVNDSLDTMMQLKTEIGDDMHAEK